ncbi:MAG TPA: hypothetical protein VGI34_08130 [Candidatus Acidoferrales bacterium]|jgi:hypothetical protein
MKIIRESAIHMDQSVSAQMARLTRLQNIPRILLLIVLIAGSAFTAAAQGSSIPTGRTGGGLDWNESFEGSTGSSGQDMEINSSATYHFGRFSVGAGIPVYLNRAVFSNGASISDGIGDFYVRLGSSWTNPLFNFGTAITGTAPTGDSNKGFSAGHGTFDWNNRIDRDFGGLTPFLDGGVANSISDTLFFHRPFTSFGYLAHGELGADLDLTHSFKLLVSAYTIAPWGTQTIISRDVVAGGTGSGGQNGRVFEVNHITAGPASINYDDGLTAGITFQPKPYMSLAVGYTRSLSYEFNTFSWGIGFNMSRLVGLRNSNK